MLSAVSPCGFLHPTLHTLTNISTGVYTLSSFKGRSVTGKGTEVGFPLRSTPASHLATAVLPPHHAHVLHGQRPAGEVSISRQGTAQVRGIKGWQLRKQLQKQRGGQEESWFSGTLQSHRHKGR